MKNRHKDFELVKFNLTPKMSQELIKFNELKKKINELKKLYNLDKNKKLLLQILKLEDELNETKTRFILEFRLNNKDEIIEYLNIRDKNDA